MKARRGAGKITFGMETIAKYMTGSDPIFMSTNHLLKHADNVEHLWRILNVVNWVEDTEADYIDEILAQCNEIINRPDWKTRLFPL